MSLLNGEKGVALVVRLVVALEKIAEFPQPQEIVKEVAVEVIKEVVKEVQVEKLVVDEHQLQELEALKSDHELQANALKEALANYKKSLIEIDKLKEAIPYNPSVLKSKGQKKQGGGGGKGSTG